MYLWSALNLGMEYLQQTTLNWHVEFYKRTNEWFQMETMLNYFLDSFGNYLQKRLISNWSNYGILQVFV